MTQIDPTKGLPVARNRPEESDASAPARSPSVEARDSISAADLVAVEDPSIVNSTRFWLAVSADSAFDHVRDDMDATDSAAMRALVEANPGIVANITTVNLRGLGLTEVPEGVFLFTEITRLDFSGNAISAIPDQINKLTNLKHLDVEGNPGCKLPTQLQQLNLDTFCFSADAKFLVGFGTIRNDEDVSLQKTNWDDFLEYMDCGPKDDASAKRRMEGPFGEVLGDGLRNPYFTVVFSD